MNICNFWFGRLWCKLTLKRIRVQCATFWCEDCKQPVDQCEFKIHKCRSAGVEG